MERQTTVIDLRGSEGSAGGADFSVLADPTGRRGRRLRHAGRAVAVLFALWLAALVLAGLGLLPGDGIPLASRSGSGTEPPPLGARSPLVPAKGSEPALAARRATPTAASHARSAPASAGSPPARRRQAARAPQVAPLRKRTTAPAPRSTSPPPAATATPIATQAPHRPTTPPGKSGTSPGHAGTAPGQTRPAKTPAPAATATPTPTHGKSGVAPGHNH
jgi:hypothetical protein